MKRAVLVYVSLLSLLAGLLLTMPSMIPSAYAIPSKTFHPHTPECTKWTSLNLSLPWAWSVAQAWAHNHHCNLDFRGATGSARNPSPQPYSAYAVWDDRQFRVDDVGSFDRGHGFINEWLWLGGGANKIPRYLFVSGDGQVSAGDDRLTAADGYAAGTVVAAGDTDVGNTLINFQPNEAHDEFVPANGRYDSGESIYRDNDPWPALAQARIREAFGLWDAIGTDTPHLIVGIAFMEVAEAPAEIMIRWQNLAFPTLGATDWVGVDDPNRVPVPVTFDSNPDNPNTGPIETWYFDANPNGPDGVRGTADDVGANQYHFFSIAIHETGHVVGLDEQDDANDVMIGLYDPGPGPINGVGPGAGGPWFTAIDADSEHGVRDLYSIPMPGIHLDAEPPRLIDLMKPVSTQWHELFPIYSRRFHLSYWEDTNGDGVLSPSDQIILWDKDTEEWAWYHVDDVTVTIKVTLKPELNESMYIEYEDGWAGYDTVIYYPVSTQWHEVYPNYSRQYHLSSWEDTNLDGVLSPSDQIDMTLKIHGEPVGPTEWYHVDEVKTDIIVTPKPSKHLDVEPPELIDLRYPISTQWHELYPIYSREYHLSSWHDTNGDGKLGPSDYIDMWLKPDGPLEWYHVDLVTVTIILTLKPYLNYTMYLEFNGTQDEFLAIGDPRSTWWHEVWPNFSIWWHILSWTDTDGSGTLTVSDQVDFADGSDWHVDAVKTDILISERIIEEDYFPDSKAKVTITGPFGSETVTLTGPTTVWVDLTSLNDTDGDGLEEVQTEIVQMELTGTSTLLGPVTVRLRNSTKHPFQRSLGLIEETANTQWGRLDLPPFAIDGTADSFFDVFFEIEAAGQTFHNDIPGNMQATITSKPPAEGETYEGHWVIPLLDEAENSTGVSLGPATHTPNPKSVVESSDAYGNKKDIFTKCHPVYAYGNCYAPYTTYPIYVVQDTTWTDGMPIPGRIPGTATTVTTNGTGQIPPTKIWTSAQAGKYDIIVDVNDDGFYNASVDALDDNDVDGAGFIVTGAVGGEAVPINLPINKITLPTPWITPILILSTAFAAASIATLYKRKRKARKASQ